MKMAEDSEYITPSGPSAATVQESQVLNDNTGNLIAVINADPSAPTINNGKVTATELLGSNVFSAFPLVVGVDAKSNLAYIYLGSTGFSTTSTTAVSSGVAVAIAATLTGRIKVSSNISGSNNTLSDGITVYVYRSIVGVPAAGAAPASGDAIIASDTYTQEGVVSNHHTFGFSLIDSGLVIGTLYTYYIASNAVTGGTAALVGGTNQTTITIETI